MGSLTGPGISSKAFVLSEPAILTSLERDDKDLATLNTMQLLKHLGYVTDISFFLYITWKNKHYQYKELCHLHFNVFHGT